MNLLITLLRPESDNNGESNKQLRNRLQQAELRAERAEALLANQEEVARRDEARRLIRSRNWEGLLQERNQELEEARQTIAARDRVIQEQLARHQQDQEQIDQLKTDKKLLQEHIELLRE